MCKVCGYDRCPAGCPNYAPIVVGKCEACGEDICAGETYYDMDGDMYHEECFEDSAVEILVEQCGAQKLTAGEQYEEDY